MRYDETETFDEMFFDALDVEGHGHARVFAKITDGRTASCGYNKKKTHPFQKRFGKNEDCIYLHAEIDAIKNWLRFCGDTEDLSDCDLFVMRIKRDGRRGPWVTGLSKPCEGCMRAIATFGIETVYYTEDNAKGLDK